MSSVLFQCLIQVQRFWLPLTIILLSVITVLSLTPLSQLPSVPVDDKWQHLLAYGALVFPMALAQPKGFWIGFCGLLFWSGAIELIQPYVNRYGEWADFAVNGAGLLLGSLMAIVIYQRMLKRSDVL